MSVSVRRRISVLVPALNEEGNIAPTVGAIDQALSETCGDWEIIVVNDGSSDATGAVAERLQSENPRVRVLHNPRCMGIGHAYDRGCEVARMDYFVYIPGDNTWPYESCRRLFDQAGSADIVVSYALNPEIRDRSRRLVSRAYTLALNLLFGRNLRYYNGLNIFPTAFVRTRPVKTFGFGFQAEVLLKALAAGLTHVEVGLQIDERAAGSSKAVSLRNILSVTLTVLRLFWEIRLGWRGSIFSAR